MSSPAVNRYPLEPLLAAMGLAHSETGAGRALGLGGSTWIEYRDKGVSARVADRLATKAGLHPALVWPEWMDDQIADVSIECADEKCSQRFVPTPGQARHKFCSTRCRKRSSERERQRRLAADPEAAERKRERQRRYHAETAGYVNRRRNERYWANRDAELERQRAYDQRRRSNAQESGSYASGCREVVGEQVA